MTEQTQPRPLPRDISNDDFRAIVEAICAGIFPAKGGPNFLMVCGPSGVGKTQAVHTLVDTFGSMLRGWFLGEYNDPPLGSLVNLPTYQRDLANGLSLKEAYDQNWELSSFMQEMLLKAAMGASDEELNRDFTLSSEQLGIVREFVKPEPHNIIFSTTLRGGYEYDCWLDALRGGVYDCTTSVLMGSKDYCVGRAVNRTAWHMDRSVAEANFDRVSAVLPERLKDIGEDGGITFYALRNGELAPVVVATKDPHESVIVKPGDRDSLWEHYFSEPAREAGLHVIMKPKVEYVRRPSAGLHPLI